jgi:hypothetical protein
VAHYTRRIVVSREWFEQLEAYLQADERTTDTSDPAWPLLLVTPYGKTLEFAPANRDTAKPPQRFVVVPRELFDQAVRELRFECSPTADDLTELVR